MQEKKGIPRAPVDGPGARTKTQSKKCVCRGYLLLRTELSMGEIVRECRGRREREKHTLDSQVQQTRTTYVQTCYYNIFFLSFLVCSITTGKRANVGSERGEGN